MRDPVLRAEAQLAYFPRSAPANSRLAIFVHGFLGDYLTTWGKLPDFLAEHADGDAVLGEWDYLFLGYPTREVTTYLDIAERIQGEWLRAAGGKPPFERSYRELALFGHSLGTLGIRQLLCQHVLPAGVLRSVTLFGPPQDGSWLARFAFTFKIADALEPQNPQLMMLRRWTEVSHGWSPWPEVQVVLGQRDLVVGHEAKVIWKGDAPLAKLNLDHSELSKPKDWRSDAVMDYIRGALR